MHVLLAFDKFKDSLTAPHACELTAAALRERHPEWTLDLCPLADGGEGFCEILTRAAGGTVETHTVTGPRGTPTLATIGFVPLANIPSPARTLLSLDIGHWSLDIPPTVAVVEMATASGLALLAPDQRDPWHTTTLGTGELIRLAAARPGVAAILLGVGGSATSDLGLGALTALGLTCHSADDARVSPPIPAHWPRVVHLTGCLSLPRPQTPNPIPCVGEHLRHLRGLPRAGGGDEHEAVARAERVHDLIVELPDGERARAAGFTHGWNTPAGPGSRSVWTAVALAPLC